METIDSINSNPKIRTGIIIILTLAVLKFVVFPLLQWNQNNIDQIFLLKKNISVKQKILTHGKEIESNLKKVSHSLKQASQYFWYDFADSGDLLLKTQKMLEKKASGLGPHHKVKIQSLQWGTPYGKTIIRAPMDLRLSALPGDLLRFIVAVESDDKFYAIDSMRLTCRSRFPEIQVNMTISAYGVRN